MNEFKVFTPKEANRTLPLVRRIVQDIQECGLKVRQTIVPKGQETESDTAVQKLMDELDDLYRELHKIGCFYQDPNFTIGLVDFPAIIDGEDVLLCWRIDEEKVSHYHGLKSGYIGRKPIPEAYLEV